MRPFAVALTAVALLAASPVLAQPDPKNPLPQPSTPNVPNPSSGTANSSSGQVRPGPNAGNSASRPEEQRGRSASPSAHTTEAPSLELREVGPNARPDQQPR
jgi:hypothetical protein